MSEIQVNTINEYTGASGVTVDGVLIKDGLVDGKDVSTLGSGGKIGQVLNQVYATATTVATDSGDGASTGLTLAITPAATSSKILVIPNINFNITNNGHGFGIKIRKTVGGSTSNVFTSNYAWLDVGGGTSDSAQGRYRADWWHLDSPNTTSEVTYTINAQTEGGGAVYFHANTTQSMLTLMEVLA
jgi:hypothetical protein